MAITAQQAVFHTRVDRILAGQGVVTMGMVFVGDDLALQRVARPRQVAVPGWLRQAVLFPACLLAGLAGHVAVTLADWHLSGLVGVAISDEMALARQAALGLCVTLVLTTVLRLGDRSMLLAKGLGVAFGMAGLHNAVHLAPDLFTRVFAAEWCAQVLARTGGQTLHLAGIIIPF